MEETTHTPIQVERSLTVERAAVDAEARTVELAFASDQPYERTFGTEVLEISERAMRSERIRSGGPVLMDHDPRDHVGVVESIRIDADNTARASVRFGRGQRAQEVFQDIQDGIRRSVSVGYVIHQMERQRDGESDIMRVTDWEPLEVSIVSVPADHSVGVGRAAEPTPSQPEPQDEVREMDEQTKTPEVDVEEVRADASRNERQRAADIMAIGQQFSRYGAESLAGEAIRDGKTVEEFQRQVLAKVGDAPAPTPEIGMSDQEARSFSMVRALNALANPTDMRAQEAASFEFEASRAAADKQGKEVRGIMVPWDVLSRELTVGTAADGGDTVATDLLAGSFIDLLRNAMVLSGMGTTMLTGLQGNVAIPRMTGGGTTYWVDEGNAPTVSQQAFDQVSMSPSTLGARTQISRKLLLQSSLDVESLVRRDLSTIMGLELERAAIAGSGSAPEPTGILNVSGIGSVAGGTDGAAPDWSDIIDLETQVANANAAIGNMSYLTNTKVRGKLKRTEKFSSTNGNPIWDSGDMPLNGYRAAVTNAVPSNLTKGTGTDLSAIIFGNFADLVIGMWGGLELQVDPYSSGDTGSVIVRSFQDVDTAVRHPESFAAMQDAITT